MSTDADVAELSDLRPIWAHYTLAGGRGTRGLVRKVEKAKRLQLLRIELTLKDKAEDQRYQYIIIEKFPPANLENMDPAEIIHHLSKLSYEAVQEAQPDKKNRPGFRSPYKDCWSPEAIAHQAHLIAPIEIRRHVFGYHKNMVNGIHAPYLLAIDSLYILVT